MPPFYLLVSLNRLVLFKLSFQGFYFQLSVKFLLAKGFAGLELVILHPDNETLSTFPAPVRALIAGVNQGETTLSVAFRTYYLGYHLFPDSSRIFVASYYLVSRFVNITVERQSATRWVYLLLKYYGAGEE